MKSVRCSGCGANLNFDGTKKIMKCQYCGTVYKDDSKYEKQEPLSQTQTINTGAINIFDTTGDRPKVKISVIVLLCVLGFFPFAFIYWAMTKARQNDWDKTHHQ